jgi:O-antigen/teichoic acid export membrane protein
MLTSHTNEPTDRVSAARIATDSLSAGTGHAATVLVGAVTAILMPRALGVEHFGHWVLFRMIILFITTTTLLGTRQIMSRFYAPLAATDPEAAGRVFKVVACVRFAVGLAAAAIGCILLRLLGGSIFGWTAALLLAMAVLFRSISVTGSVLLYGTTRIRSVAILQFLMAAIVPLGVLVAYLSGGLAAIPVACAACEGIVMLAAIWLVRHDLSWPKGWLRGQQQLEILRFGGHVAPAALGGAAFGNVAVMFAAALGANETQMAFIGVAMRLHGVVLAGLLAMNRAMLPSLSIMASHGGRERSIHWLSLLCRAGGIFIFGAAGAMAFFGRPIISLIWGPDYQPALFPICLGFVAAMPLWLAATHVNLAIVINRPELQLRSVAWLYIGLTAALFGLPMIQMPERVWLAILVAAACYMASLLISLRRNGIVLPHLQRFWGVAAVALLPIVLMYREMNPIIMAPLWAAAFLLSILASGCLRLDEIRRITSQLRAVFQRSEP